MSQMGTGKPSALPVPSHRKPVLPNSALPARLGNVAPSEINSAVPRATYREPSVAINGATRNCEISAPLRAPTAAPAPSASATTSQVWK